MGKAVAAWLMVASAMAATTSSPRDVVQAAVTRVVAVLQNDFEASPLDRPRTEMRRAEVRRIAAELFDGIRRMANAIRERRGLSGLFDAVALHVVDPAVEWAPNAAVFNPAIG